MTIYPTWSRLNANQIISEEQLDDIPDFYIERDGQDKKWRVKWRTSTCWSGPFQTAAEAMRSVEDNER